jgi:hypothetical protein
MIGGVSRNMDTSSKFLSKKLLRILNWNNYFYVRQNI